MVLREEEAYNIDVQMFSSSSSFSCFSSQKDKCQQRRLCSTVWVIDLKSFLAGMVMVGFLGLAHQSVGNLRGGQLQAITYLDFRDEKQHGSTLMHPSVINSTANHDYYDDFSSIKSSMNSNDPSCNSNMSRGYINDVYNQSQHYYDPFNKVTDELKDRDTAHHQISKHDYDRQDDDIVTETRSFHAYGQASALFVHMGSYRGGPDSFAVIGLGAKPAHVYGNAGFECEWVSSRENSSIKGRTRKLLPDWNMGRQYTTVVVNCSFEKPVGVDGEGGKLMVSALYGEGSGRWDLMPERFVALTEMENEYDENKFRPPYPYKFVYCGSPLYGKLSAQRIREWLAYHAKLFGKRAHFYLYDAGGITASVERALRPWRKRGYVTVQDIRGQEVFDGYYHNQFLVVNDCLHRTRFLSDQWTFFFDVDEYVYVETKEEESLESVMQGFSNYTQVIFRQKPMAAHICAAQPHHDKSSSRRSKWGFEKLVYRNVKAGMKWDRKYAIQARRAFTTGVHRSDDIEGDNIVRDSLGYFPESEVPKLWYYHFHNTITHLHGDLCRTYAHSNNSSTNNGSSSSSSSSSSVSSSVDAAALDEPADFYDIDGTPFRLDNGLQQLAPSIKDFELHQIGPQPSTLSN